MLPMPSQTKFARESRRAVRTQSPQCDLSLTDSDTLMGYDIEEYKGLSLKRKVCCRHYVYRILDSCRRSTRLDRNSSFFARTSLIHSLVTSAARVASSTASAASTSSTHEVLSPMSEMSVYDVLGSLLHLHLPQAWIRHESRKIGHSSTTLTTATTKTLGHRTKLRVLHDSGHLLWIGHQVLCHAA